MKPKSLLTYITLSILLCSCYEYRQLPNSSILDKYIGRSEHKILLEFGPPDKTVSDGSDGKILAYVKDTDPTTITGLYEDYDDHLYTVSKTHVMHWYLQFYINKQDSVYAYRSNIPGRIIRVKVNAPDRNAPPPSPFKIFSHKTDTSKKN